MKRAERLAAKIQFTEENSPRFAPFAYGQLGLQTGQAPSQDNLNRAGGTARAGEGKVEKGDRFGYGQYKDFHLPDVLRPGRSSCHRGWVPQPLTEDE
jgi:hypothetical protein